MAGRNPAEDDFYVEDINSNFPSISWSDELDASNDDKDDKNDSQCLKNRNFVSQNLLSSSIPEASTVTKNSSGKKANGLFRSARFSSPMHIHGFKQPPGEPPVRSK